VERKIYRDSSTFFGRYDTLNPGDAMVGRLRLKSGEEHLLLDLESRGIVLMPSATAQLCSRSKVYQTRVLGRFMVPGSQVVYTRHDMLEVVTCYGRDGVDPVVCKLDRANGGVGILRFSSIEDVYNQAVLGTLAFPFVVQPFISEARDVRVVLLGEYVEAYERSNPNNFRNNLHCGGEATAWDLDRTQLDLCRAIMERAGFVYAHIDLLIAPDGAVYLNEINLRGGLKGAVIDQQGYLDRVASIHDGFVAELGEGCDVQKRGSRGCRL